MEKLKEGGHFIAAKARADVQTPEASLDEIVTRARPCSGAAWRRGNFHRQPLRRGGLWQTRLEWTLELSSPGAKAGGAQGLLLAEGGESQATGLKLLHQTSALCGSVSRHARTFASLGSAHQPALLIYLRLCSSLEALPRRG